MTATQARLLNTTRLASQHETAKQARLFNTTRLASQHETAKQAMRFPRLARRQGGRRRRRCRLPTMLPLTRSTRRARVHKARRGGSQQHQPVPILPPTRPRMHTRRRRQRAPPTRPCAPAWLRRWPRRLAPAWLRRWLRPRASNVPIRPCASAWLRWRANECLKRPGRRRERARGEQLILPKPAHPPAWSP